MGRLSGRIRRAASAVRGLSRPRAGAGADEATAGQEHPDATLLIDSPLFDPEWYRRTTGAQGSAEALAAHYLRRRPSERTSPHPLFLRDYVAGELRSRLGDEVADRDALLVYLRRNLRFPTHPLFDVEHYVRGTSGARRHPRGAFGHYLDADPRDRGPAAEWLDAGQDLEEWVAAQHTAWRERQRGGASQEVGRAWLDDPAPASAGTDVDDVLVVVEAGRSRSHLRQSLVSLAAQRRVRWTALVADPGLEGCEDLLAEVLPAGRWARIDAADAERRWVLGPALVDASAASEHGPPDASWVAFLPSGHVWEPDRLARLVDHADRQDAGVVCDVLEETRPDGSTVLLGRGMVAGLSRSHEWTDVSRLLVRGDLLRAPDVVPDPTMGRGWEFELVSRLAAPRGIPALRVVGSRRSLRDVRTAHRLPPRVRSRVPDEVVPTGAHEVLASRLVDWKAVGEAPRRQGLTSVVIVTYRDWQMTRDAVASVLAAADHDPRRAEVEVVVVDNGCGAGAAAVLASWPSRDARVRVVHEPVNHGFGLGSNVGFAATRGDVVVFLNNDTVVTDGWLSALRDSLADPDVLGSQPLLLYPTGVIQCAGVLLPRPGGMPYPLLQGFPTLDAENVAALRLPAVTGAALAVRADDVVRARGFDPVFLNGMEDVDLCLRMSRSRPGHFVCRPDSLVTHHESRTPGRFRHLASNRRLYLERWGRAAGADDAAWHELGYEVVGRDTPPEAGLTRDISVTTPLLRRRPRASVVEGRPCLRWAIKNPAPALPAGDLWGDTHFAEALAGSLRELGQDVTVDRRQEHARSTGRHDDVELVLRGLAPYRPARHNVSLCWVISHPDLVPLAELASFDRVLAASETWARQRSSDWGIAVEPLLQATDPATFNPDSAVPDSGHAVLFVGSSRRTTRPIVSTSIERGLPLSIYGREWDGLVDRHYVKGEYVPNDMLGAAYRSAGVVLNDHWDDMRRHGFVSNRLFDAAASGARIVTDDVGGLPDVFGKSVQVALNGDDLVRLTSLAEPDSVFGTDEERRLVAAEVARDHSFAARAERLLEVAIEARRGRHP